MINLTTYYIFIEPIYSIAAWMDGYTDTVQLSYLARWVYSDQALGMKDI